uniref:Uncharacterized protein n=1 Tax=Arundo donax TaxID=35708 RepID=A0A0A9GUC2_ARUDO
MEVTNTESRELAGYSSGILESTSCNLFFFGSSLHPQEDLILHII